VRIVPGNFHLEWLHDVDIEDPTDEQILAYDETAGLWKNIDIPESAAVISSPTAPANTTAIWFNTENGNTYIYYDDFWTSIAGSTGAPIISDTAPTSPVLGTQWFNSSTGKSYLYYSNAWVEIDSNGTSTASTGNLVINGAFDIWQRGTSFTGIQVTADRWRAISSSTQTVARTTDVPNSTFAYSAQIGASVTTFNSFDQRIESANLAIEGTTVTVSLWAKNVSGSSGIRAEFRSATAVDNFASDTFIGVVLLAPAGSFSSSWQKYSGTIAITDTAKTNGLVLRIQRTASEAGTSHIITGVQLEAGSVATPFRRNAPSIQAELAACQRYYIRNTATSAFSVFGQGSAQSTTASRQLVKLPVTMRIQPTSVDFSTLRLSDGVAANPTVTALTIQSDTSHNQTMTVTAVVASGLTDFRNYYLYANNSTSAFIGFSAEL
jgi:hypothetical protein